MTDNRRRSSQSAQRAWSRVLNSSPRDYQRAMWDDLGPDMRRPSGGLWASKSLARMFGPAYIVVTPHGADPVPFCRGRSLVLGSWMSVRHPEEAARLKIGDDHAEIPVLHIGCVPSDEMPRCG